MELNLRDKSSRIQYGITCLDTWKTSENKKPACTSHSVLATDSLLVYTIYSHWHRSNPEVGIGLSSGRFFFVSSLEVPIFCRVSYRDPESAEMPDFARLIFEFSSGNAIFWKLVEIFSLICDKLVELDFDSNPIFSFSNSLEKTISEHFNIQSDYNTLPFLECDSHEVKK